MTLEEIEEAAGRHLLGMDLCPPIAWPDQDFDGPRPFIEFRHIPATVTDATLAGERPTWRGQFLLTVMAERAGLAKEARSIAGRVMARFPHTLRLPAPSGVVLIRKPPEARSGFPDGSDWRLPVVIDYQTE